MLEKDKTILGIDPGYDKCGFGIIHGCGMDWEHIAHGIIKTRAGVSFSERLLEVAKDYEILLTRFTPSVVIIEELFFSQSTTTALKVAEVRGIIRLLAIKKGIEVIEVKPTEVKLAIVGHGRAEKKQIQALVKKTLKLKHIPKPDDAADALAIALTGAMRKRFDE